MLGEESQTGVLVGKIEKLTGELEGREQYIQRLQRESRDFEDDVLHEEQKYVDGIGELKNSIKLRDREIEELRGVIADLQKELKNVRDLNTKLGSDVADLDRIKIETWLLQ